MIPEEVPAYQIVKAKLEEIDTSIKVERVTYDPARTMAYKFHLMKKDIKCEVLFERAFLDDLKDYKGPRTSEYWSTMRRRLTNNLVIPLQLCGLISSPSEFFFESNQVWEKDSGQRMDVSFSSDEYEIFQDGLKLLFHYLEEQRRATAHLRLKVFPYDEDIEYIKNMLLYRNRELTERGPCDVRDSISLTSRIYLKAAAIVNIIALENEISQGIHLDAIKNEIRRKINLILKILASPNFEGVKIPDYLIKYKEEIKLKQPMPTKLKSSEHKTYDVVLSFAGEDRDYAEKLASLLKEDGFSVFYDKYEEHDLWGKNLYDHLSQIYSEAGRYCVMFLSKNYAKKQWPTFERQSAQERAFKEHREYILPIRVDDTKIPGILDTTCYLDLREKNIQEIYDILKKKLLALKYDDKCTGTLTTVMESSDVETFIQRTGPSARKKEVQKIIDEYYAALKSKKYFEGIGGKGICALSIVPELSSVELDLSNLPGNFNTLFEPILFSSGACSEKITGHSSFAHALRGGDRVPYAVTEVTGLGEVKAYNSSMLENNYYIPSIAYGREIIIAFYRYLTSLKEFGISSPFFINTAMLDVQGYRMQTEKMPGGRAFQAEDIRPPVCRIANYSHFATKQDVAKAVRPMFDYIWREFGFDKCFNYSEVGEWLSTL
jgi:hypothetical protein